MIAAPDAAVGQVQLRGVVCLALQLYALVVLARALLSWFSVPSEGPMASVARVLWAMTEPVLGPLRRALPAAPVGGVGLDLGPILLLVAIWVATWVVC